MKGQRFSRVAVGITTTKAAKAVEITSSTQTPKALKCFKGKFKFESFRTPDSGTDHLVLELDATDPSDFYNTWKAEIPTGSRIILGQTLEGIWLTIAEACE